MNNQIDWSKVKSVAFKPEYADKVPWKRASGGQSIGVPANIPFRVAQAAGDNVCLQWPGWRHIAVPKSFFQ